MISPLTPVQINGYRFYTNRMGNHSKVTLFSYHKEAESPQLELHKEYRFGHQIPLRFHNCQ